MHRRIILLTLSVPRKNFANFVKRVNRARVKRGLPRMKYIYSIEQGSKSGRIHFHVIMTGGLTINEIASIWGKAMLTSPAIDV